MSINKKNPYLTIQAKRAGGKESGVKTLKGTPPPGSKIVVAMSGGVDSSVAAILLKEQGYDLIGIALQTTDYSKYLEDDSGGSCCSTRDMEDARRVAEKLEMPFYVLDTEKAFDNLVVDYFISDYLQGRTPNPCAMCNTRVKFNHLYKKAMDLGADYVATGHYAKLSYEPGMGYALWRGDDNHKDQTYFLFNLTQRQLEHTLFPVGHLEKTEVRKIAEKYGLQVASKPDSNEICFVPGNNYSAFIQSRTTVDQRKSGYIVTGNKVVLGHHDGVYNYTIGQRKGLGPALDMARSMGMEVNDFYVVGIDSLKGLVILGPESELMGFGLICDRVNWVVNPKLYEKRRLKIKIRYGAEAVDGEVELLADNNVKVRFVHSQRAITPGQACVFYDGNLCLGGGWIEEAVFIPEEERPDENLDDGPPVLRV